MIFFNKDFMVRVFPIISSPIFIFLISLVFAVNCRSSEYRKKQETDGKGAEIEDSGRQINPDKKETNKIKKEKSQKIPAGVKVNERPDSKGRRVRTYFYGAELIREKKIIKGIPTIRMSIRGGAVLVHNDVVITAPRMVIDGGIKAHCVGGVQIVDRKNGIRIKARHADYNRNEQRIKLYGRPFMVVRKNKKEKPVLITAKRMIRNLAANVSILEEDVRIIHTDWTILGDSGKYYDQQNKIVLRENPILISRDRIITGLELTYMPQEKKLILEKDVVFFSHNTTLSFGPISDTETGQFVSLEQFARDGGNIATVKNKTGKNRKGKKEKLEITANRLVYHFESNKEPFAELMGNVFLKQDDLELKAPYMKAIGKDFHSINAEKGIDMLVRTENIHITAGVMRYSKLKQKIRLEESPKMEFLKKESNEVKATMTGSFMERDLKTNQTVVRGNVKIVREEYTISGEQATYFETAEVIRIEGEPSIEQGGGLIRCEQILIFPKKNRLLLVNRITGEIGK